MKYILEKEDCPYIKNDISLRINEVYVFIILVSGTGIFSKPKLISYIGRLEEINVDQEELRINGSFGFKIKKNKIKFKNIIKIDKVNIEERLVPYFVDDHYYSAIDTEQITDEKE